VVDGMFALFERQAREHPDAPFLITGSYLDTAPADWVADRDGTRLTFHSEHRPIDALGARRPCHERHTRLCVAGPEGALRIDRSWYPNVVPISTTLVDNERHAQQKPRYREAFEDGSDGTRTRERPRTIPSFQARCITRAPRMSSATARPP